MKKKFLNMISDNKSYFKKIINNKSFYLGLIISCLFLFSYLKNFDNNKFSNAIVNVNVSNLLLASLLLMFVIYLRAIRWRYLIQENTINNNILYKGQLIGYFVNNVLPLRIGELAKAYYIGNKKNLSKSFILGTVVSERIFDFFGLIFLLFILFNSSLFFIIVDKFFYGVISVLILLLL